MKGLEGCVKNMKGEGFFAADIKMPTGADRKKQVRTKICRFCAQFKMEVTPLLLCKAL